MQNYSTIIGVIELRQKNVGYATTQKRGPEAVRYWLQYLDYVSSLAKLDLLAIDDFGLMDLNLDKCRDLFEVIDRRDGRKSTIIVSKFPIHTWFDLFQEHTYADACLARITDKRHSYRLEMNGISMRNAVK